MSKKMYFSAFMVMAAAYGVSYGFSTVSARAENSGDKGVGPVKELKLEDLSEGMAKEGKVVFDAKCSACHKMAERYVGPALGEVTKRRTPEWIMNMILNPAEMLEKNDTAKELLGEFMTPMPFQNVSEEEARKTLEYFRYYAAKGEVKADAKGKEKKTDKVNSKGNKKK